MLLSEAIDTFFRRHVKGERMLPWSVVDAAYIASSVEAGFGHLPSVDGDQYAAEQHAQADGFVPTAADFPLT